MYIITLTAVGNNAIVVIEACAKDVSSNSDPSSLVTVEVNLLSTTYLWLTNVHKYVFTLHFSYC